MQQAPIWTILLDIDGTLLRSQGAGLHAIQQVMSNHFGIQSLPKIEVHGRTDRGIWEELFTKLEISVPESFSPYIDDYCVQLEKRLELYPGIVLPGVESFMRELSSDPRTAVGILTGNARRAANIKLERFLLQRFVESFGGYGDLYSDRNQVAKAAEQSAIEHLGAEYHGKRCLVIGDTDRDIRCARWIDAKVIAVCTGGQDRKTLEAAGPDLVLDDLTQGEVVFEFINRCEADLGDSSAS